MTAGAGRSDRELLRSYHDDGDLEAREELIERYLPLVRSLARRYAKLWEEVFRRGVERGEVPAALDARLAATAAVALCNGAVPYLEPKAPEEISAFVDGLATLFMTGALGS